MSNCYYCRVAFSWIPLDYNFPLSTINTDCQSVHYRQDYYPSCWTSTALPVAGITLQCLTFKTENQNYGPTTTPEPELTNSDAIPCWQDTVYVYSEWSVQSSLSGHRSAALSLSYLDIWMSHLLIPSKLQLVIPRFVTLHNWSSVLNPNVLKHFPLDAVSGKSNIMPMTNMEFW